MNRNKKMIILGLSIVVISLIYFCFSNKGDKVVLKEKKRNYVDEEVLKEEMISGIKFSNMSFNTKDGFTTLLADVTNTTGSDINKEELYMILKNNEDEEVDRLYIFIPNGLKVGETKTISATMQNEFEEISNKEIVF